MTFRGFTVIAFLISLITGMASDWKSHPAFYGEIGDVVETPEYVYFTSKVLPPNDFFPDAFSLFRYDKSGEELQVLSADNLLSYNTVSHVGYCPEKKYLAVVYSNYDIDLIMDDGKVINIPDYRISDINYSKRVNSLSFYPSANRIYIATDFGYVAIDDSKCQIAASWITGEASDGIARIGDRLLIIRGDDLYLKNADERYVSSEDPELAATFPYLSSVHSLGNEKAVLLSGNGRDASFRIMTISDGGVGSSEKFSCEYVNVGNNRRGVTVISKNDIYQIERDGSVSSLPLPSSDRGHCVGSYDLRELWIGDSKKGIKSVRPGEEGGTVVTRDYISPDSPSPFISTEMHLHPDKGMLVQNFGFDYNFSQINASQELLLSGYKDGKWMNYSPAYTNPVQGRVISRPGGFAIDPDNPDYVYVSSVENGFARINLSDGEDIIHFSKPTDPSRDLPGFVPFVAEQTGLNKWSCRFSTPRFDRDGNLWMSYTDLDDQTPPGLHLLCWISEDRKGTYSAENLRKPGFLKVPGISPTNIDEVIPLRSDSRGGWLLYCNKVYDGVFAVFDTRGTPLDGGDDIVSVIRSIVDQDGNLVDFHNVRTLWEDVATGYVWVGHSGGVFYFDPEDFMEGRGKVYRVKVARNDGTNLADYLLDQVTVNKITSDNEGRKWFATAGAGVISLSADGRSVEHELNAETSGLPDNSVYALEFNPETSSLLISCGGGITEYYIRGNGKTDAKEDVRAYPNPVRPDYIGYVTIDRLPSDCLVKIIDASGSLVKELESDFSGEARWDVTNLQFSRVRSGVYFILASSKREGDGFSTVGKILVVN